MGIGSALPLLTTTSPGSGSAGPLLRSSIYATLNITTTSAIISIRTRANTILPPVLSSAEDSRMGSWKRKREAVREKRVAERDLRGHFFAERRL